MLKAFSAGRDAAALRLVGGPPLRAVEQIQFEGAQFRREPTVNVAANNTGCCDPSPIHWYS